MSLLTNLFRLIPPSLSANYCPKPNTWQQLANDLVGSTQVNFAINSGNFLYNTGSSTPSPENRIFPWIRPDGKLWLFRDGFWTTPYQFDAGPNGLRMDWEAPVNGSPGGLWLFGGGDGTDPTVTSPTATTGSFWTVDANYAGRVTVAPGDVPVTTPTLTLAVGDTGGEGQHTLDSSEGGSEAHQHYFGQTNASSDDAFFAKGALNSALNYLGFYITGSGPNIETQQTTADLLTLANTVDPIGPHNNMQPYRVAYKIKRTSRIYLTLPG